jgi:hypothetical protein
MERASHKRLQNITANLTGTDRTTSFTSTYMFLVTKNNWPYTVG